MLHVTDDHRRARIARRHGIAPAHRYADVLTATGSMTALHATEPTTPHLALHARIAEVTVADVESALYDARSLVKVMGMRRTLFVVGRELVAPIAGSAGRRVADTTRRRLEKMAAEHDPEPGWIDAARASVVAALEGTQRSARELRDELVHLGGTVMSGAGTKWATEMPLMTQLLTIFSADGSVARARNAGHWRISRPTWTTTASWLGHALEPTDERVGYAQLVRRWLWTFGPGTEADLVWWLGSTKAAVRAALADVEAVAVALDGGATGYVLPDDTEDLERPPDRDRWVALLPTLDPTTMGWRDRAFYLDAAHVPYLFDTVGNGGTTVWVDGRIVGCWVQDEAERVRPVLLEDAPTAVRRRIDAEAERLDAFLGGEHVTNVFASPQMRAARLP